ncbi:collagen alpha-1(I) chain-like [Herpailurus yagouaroundi]|uniref:collagen alpha-1(I) chain-like n=1 Tax=Herpailurus yagouaroundi TaxID=1608482 RepID=UPI001AD6A16A|nr:collagen alpha-1(I) chain-like [Puma yagouaroundi]
MSLESRGLGVLPPSSPPSPTRGPRRPRVALGPSQATALTGYVTLGNGDLERSCPAHPRGGGYPPGRKTLCEPLGAAGTQSSQGIRGRTKLTPDNAPPPPRGRKAGPHAFGPPTPETNPRPSPPGPLRDPPPLRGRAGGAVGHPLLRRLAEAGRQRAARGRALPRGRPRPRSASGAQTLASRAWPRATQARLRLRLSCAAASGAGV